MKTRQWRYRQMPPRWFFPGLVNEHRLRPLQQWPSVRRSLIHCDRRQYKAPLLVLPTDVIAIVQYRAPNDGREPQRFHQGSLQYRFRRHGLLIVFADVQFRPFLLVLDGRYQPQLCWLILELLCVIFHRWRRSSRRVRPMLRQHLLPRLRRTRLHQECQLRVRSFRSFDFVVMTGAMLNYAPNRPMLFQHWLLP